MAVRFPSWVRSVALGLGLGLGLGGVARARSRSTGAVERDVVIGGKAELDAMLAFAGLDSHWRRAFAAAALGESGFHSNVYLGDAREAPAWARISNQNDSLGARTVEDGRQAYERNESWLRDCGWPAKRYFFSGGWLQQFPANGAYVYKGTPLACLDPWYCLDAVEQVVPLLGITQRVIRRDSFQSLPTFLNWRVGIGNPASMGKPESLERMRSGKNKFGERLEQLGTDRSFAEQPITPFPDFDPVALRQRLIAEFRGGHSPFFRHKP